MNFNNPFPATYQSRPYIIPNQNQMSMPPQQYGSYQLPMNQAYYQQNQQTPSSPQLPMQNQSHLNYGMNSSEIIWVTNEQEVENYIPDQNQNVMFMDINQMKLYTKDGSNGLIRDFDLVESQESVQRYQQMKQMENAQFPVIDATVRDASYSGLDMQDIERKMNEKFDILEKHIAELSQNFSGYKNNKQKNRNGGLNNEQ